MLKFINAFFFYIYIYSLTTFHFMTVSQALGFPQLLPVPSSHDGFLHLVAVLQFKSNHDSFTASMYHA